MMRNILKTLLPAVAAAVTLCAASGENYNVLFISDTHFGDADTYEVIDAASGKLRTKKDPRRMEKALPAYRAMFKDMAAHADSRTAFVVEGGDLVEGWAKDQAAHAAQLRQAMTEMKSFFSCPILGVTGNHDANGKFGRAAFDEVMLPHLREAAKQPDLKDGNYTVRKGDDLWIFHDYYLGGSTRERLDFPIRILRGLDWKPRYVFLVTHAPLLQFPNAAINELLAELDKYRSFILCGHTHRTLLLTAKRPGGTITQFSIGTLFTADTKKAMFKVVASTPEEFLPELRRRATRFKCLDEVEKNLIPYLTEAWFIKGHGYAKIDISDAGVTITVQSAYLAQKPIVVLKDGK